MTKLFRIFGKYSDYKNYYAVEDLEYLDTGDAITDGDNTYYIVSVGYATTLDTINERQIPIRTYEFNKDIYNYKSRKYYKL
jgi:hypothetical protein